MAENRHVQHLRSKVVENGKPKLPASSALTFGEIAVNYADNVETLSIKNENGNIVVFSSDDYYTKEKLGTAFTGANSAFTVTEGLDEKVNNDELDDKIADAIATADTVSGAIETIVNDKLAAYSSATEIEEALSGKSDVGHHHVVADIDDFESGVETVVSSSETITERIESVVASAITNNESVSASVESVISAFTEETLDDRYAFKEHTHEANAITDFNSAVEGVVSTSNTITERIESVVASAITNNESVSASVSTIVEEKLEDYSTTQQIETILEDYAKKGLTDNVSEFINDASYVTSGQVEPMVAAAISGSDAVISAITEILSDNSGITEVINNVVSGQIEGAVSGKADTSAMTLAIEEATSGKANSDDVHEWIEAVTSGKVDTSVYEQFTGATEASLSGKVDNDTYTAYTAATEEVLNSKLDKSTYGAYTATTEAILSEKADSSGVTEEIAAAVSGKVDNSTYTAYTSSTYNVLETKFAGVDYVKADNKIYFYNNSSNTGTSIGEIDTNDFVVDGMIEDVAISSITSGGSEVEVLHITWNSDASGKTTDIPLTDIFNPSNYYDTDAIDNIVSGINQTIEDSEFDGKSSGVTAMTGYEKAAQFTAIETSDTLNDAIGKLEKGIESATSGGVNTVSLDSGTTDGSLRLIVNGSGDTDVFIPGLGTMAYADESNYLTAQELTGSSTNITVYRATSAATAVRLSNTSAIGSGTKPVFFTSNGVPSACTHSLGSDVPANAVFTDTATTLSGHYSPTAAANSTKSATASSTSELDWGSAVITGVTLSGDSRGHITAVAVASGKLKTPVTSVTTSSTSGNISVDGSDVAVAGLGTAAYRNEEYFASSGVVNTVSGTADAAKAVTDFYSGHNTANTLANLATDKRLIIATITASTNTLSLSGNSLADGYEIHIIVTNNGSSDTTITLPNSGNYISVGDAINIKSGKTGEINIISDGTNKYVRGV